ncbi:MAG: family 1 glycosylhydrolase [Bacilli bacterium]|nr:family 1 glycosylhydrolase [Bacilli bacterium]
MKDFEFGVGVSAYQIEGSPHLYNKLPSVWDTFAHQKRKIKDGSTGDIAVDFINRYKEDIKIIKDLGADSFRLSLSWTRIMNEDDSINKEGLQLYIDIIDEIINNGLKPVITLFHWDLPQYLQDMGGWLNPITLDKFEKYADVVSKTFKGKCMEYHTINEPQCFINVGYRKGEHAPGKKYNLKKILHISHNVLLGHAKAYYAIKRNDKKALASIVSCGSVSLPVNEEPSNIEIARKHYFSLSYFNTYKVALFLDPIFLGDYPKEYYKLYKHKIDFIKDGDMDYIKGTSDICYQNIYAGVYVGKGHRKIKFDNGDLPWLHITPKCLYYGPKFLYERYHKPIIISENGLSTTDVLEDNKVHDVKRVKFINDYVQCLMDAKNDGVDVRGYYYWSIFDNFEWGEGYTSRFGLLYINYQTQERIKKDSFFAYKDLIKKYK